MSSTRKRHRGAQKGNQNAAKHTEARRRKEYMSFFGQRWTIDTGKHIQAYLSRHSQSQKQFLDDIVKEKILTITSDG